VTFSVTVPVPLAAVLFGAGRSGALNVRNADDWLGGLQEAAEGGPSWIVLGDVHGSKAGTSLKFNGDAEFGRA
jgi:hypothetical protein